MSTKPSSLLQIIFWSIWHFSQGTLSMKGLTLMILWANLPYTKSCKKTEKWLKPWHMGTHLIVLSLSYQMNTNVPGLRCFSKFLSPCVLDESSFSIGRANKGKGALLSASWQNKKRFHTHVFSTLRAHATSWKDPFPRCYDDWVILAP